MRRGRCKVNVEPEDGKKLRNRLRRIEGQVRGVRRMVQEEVPCTDILTQLGSIVAATEQVGLFILKQHVEHYIREYFQDGGEVQEIMGELVPAVESLTRREMLRRPPSRPPRST